MADEQNRTGERLSHEGAEAFRATLRTMVSQCRRELLVFSEQLLKAVYHDPLVVEEISELARSSSKVKVQLLVRDTTTLWRDYHRLTPLIQRLSSRIELRQIQATASTKDWEFAVGDRRHVLICEDREAWAATYLPEDRVRAAKYAEIFAQEWNLGKADPNLRRLSL